MALISFKHKLIFIKTTKTAGTSIEVDLSQRLEDSAIVTPIFPEVPGHRVRNYIVADDERGYYNHMRATQIRDFLEADRFDRFTKICVERDPVDKCISHFHMLHNSPDHKQDLAETWDSYCAAGRFPVDIHKYTEIGEDGTRHVLVDHILRYENLPTELPAVLAQVGINDFHLKTRAKSEYSKIKLLRAADVKPHHRVIIEQAFSETTEVIQRHRRRLA